MSKNNYSANLVKNTFLLSINKFISPFISFLLLPIYTNNIAPDEYGVTDIIQTYVALLVPILLVRLDIGMFRFLVERRGDKKAVSEIVTNTVAIVTPSTALATALMAVAIVFNILPFQAATLFYFLNVMANNIINPLTRGLGKNPLFAVASIVDVFLKLILGIIFVLALQMGGYGLILSLGLSTLVNNIICLFGVRSEISFKRDLLNKSLRKELVRLSAPIIADGVSFWVINTSDRTIISMVLGVSANGIYAIANKFSNLIGSLTNIFWMSWSEQASIAVTDKNYPAFVSKIFNSYFKIVASITMCLIAAVPILFQITINARYKEAIYFIPPLIIGLLLNALASFYGPIYLAYKKSKEVAISTSIAAVINLVLDLVLIWFVGIWAAVISTIAAYLFILIYRFIDAKKMVKITYSLKSCLVTIIFIGICTAMYYINNPIINLANIIFAAIISVALNKEAFAKLAKIAKRKLAKR